MKFNHKLILCFTAPLVIFIGALSTSIWGLKKTQADARIYIEQDQAIHSSLQDMYAQQMQMGQSVRSIVLDPLDKNANLHLKNAQVRYEEKFKEAMANAKGGPFESVILANNEAWKKISLIHDEVASIANFDDLRANDLLRENETPQWEILRENSIKALNATKDHADQVRLQTQKDSQFFETIALALSIFAVIFASILKVMMIRTVNREIGGDPEQARKDLIKISDGDLRHDNAYYQTGLMRDLGTMRSSLRDLVNDVQNAAHQIHGASKEISHGNNDLSNRTEQQASALEETSAAMEQLNATVQQNAATAVSANNLAKNSTKVAMKGTQVVNEVVVSMRSIREKSQRIADIISVIDSIAFQTNILALNAAVEAARAGEQGRGFAVVASEVRALAKRSADAAKEIKTLITESLDSVETGNELVEQAGLTMTEVMNSIQNVTTLMDEISVSSQQQSAGFAQISSAISSMDSATQQNAALVEESTAASAELHNQASNLIQSVSSFKI